MGVLNGPPPPDTNYAVNYLSVVGVFSIFATSLCAARIWTRIQPKVVLRIDDYMILFATILSLAVYVVAIINTVHGWGHHIAYVPRNRAAIAFKCMFAQQILWICAIALTRLSIAWSLLRLSPARIWQWSLWAILSTQLLIYIFHMVFQFFNCRPLRSSWEPVYSVKCWPRKYILIYGWTSNGILVTFDFILALMPIHLIRALHRSSREKILICCLMAMGLFAGAIAAYRMSITRSTFAGDLLSSTVMLSMWCELELLLGIVAACSAPLKAPAERVLHRLGLLASRIDMTRPSFVVTLQELPSSQGSRSTSRLDSAHTGDANLEKGEVQNSAISAADTVHGVP